MTIWLPEYSTISPADVVVCTSFRGRLDPIEPTCSKPPYIDMLIVRGSAETRLKSASTDSLSSHRTSTNVSLILSFMTGSASSVISVCSASDTGVASVRLSDSNCCAVGSVVGTGVSCAFTVVAVV